jgi:hypothetical protein
LDVVFADTCFALFGADELESFGCLGDERSASVGQFVVNDGRAIGGGISHCF